MRPARTGPTGGGPARNGISAETDWFGPWPDSGPEVLWRADIGTGFSTISIADGKAYTMGNTAKAKTDEDQQDQIFCFDAATGKLIWKYAYDCPLDPLYYKGGTSATPTVHDGRVYTFSKKGHVFCLDAKTGKPLWARDVEEEDGFKPPKWGFAGSVLIHGELAVINAGGGGIALDRKSGALAWKGPDGISGYSTPLPFAAGGREGLALYTAKALIAVEADTGKRYWMQPWTTAYDVNASEPIFFGDRVFISTGYKAGCALFDVGSEGLEPVWRNKNMSNQCNSSVLHEGYLYGFDGNVGGRGILTSMDWKTGEKAWTKKGLGTGSVTLADGKLIVLSETGTLLILKADPKKYDELASAPVVKGLCWTVPVLSHGRIYARSAEGDLVCVNPKPKVADAEK